jgi:cytochrome c553
MKRFFIHAGITLLILLGMGVLVVVTGLVPVAASSGHFAATRWFLNFAKSRAVATHSWDITEPGSLQDNDLVIKGAAIYENNCSWCHGSPLKPTPPIMAAATPRPPLLEGRIESYDPRELFYIVKHGIKFTGMPAWPTQQRDDEVWAMVAFLQTYSNLDKSEYERLALGEHRTPQQAESAKPGPPDPSIVALSANCQNCHAVDGNGRGNGAFPKLAGQSKEYLQASLIAFRQGNRHSGAMQPLAANLSDQEIEQLAQYYAQIKQEPTSSGSSDAKPSDRSDLANTSQIRQAIQRGKHLANTGIPKKLVPSCIDCHRIDGENANPNYPQLNGQYADYLELQLKLFKDRKRGGTDYADLMHAPAAALTEQQIRDLSLYFSSLPNQ